MMNLGEVFEEGLRGFVMVTQSPSWLASPGAPTQLAERGTADSPSYHDLLGFKFGVQVEKIPEI